MADTTPLLSSAESSPAPEDFLTDVIFFHGKELRTGMGMRQSFIRKPGTEQVLVRIGIGREGVFKVDGTENKVLEHWRFSDLKDWSFSGYSCTIQFKSSNKNYSVRTDDGEAICSYIEDFQKHPEQALKRARENPPNSKIPESGVRTLRRKFSGPDLNPPAASDVKFYTMNRRRKTPLDPTSRISHNIEVDSRLRSAYSHDALSHSSSDSSSVGSFVKDGKMNGIPNDDKNKISKQDKPVSGGVHSGPTSTRGEATQNQNTQPRKNSGSASPSHPSSPLLQRRMAFEQQVSDPSLKVESTPKTKKEPAESEDPEDYFMLRQRSVSETTVQRGNSRPINLIQTVQMPWASQNKSPKNPGREFKSQTLGPRGGAPVNSGREKQRPVQVQNMSKLTGKRSISPSGSEVSGDHVPLIHANSNMSVSSDEFQSLHTTRQYERRLSREAEGKEWYHSSSPDEQSRNVSPPYDNLSRSDSGMSSERMEFSSGIRSLKRDDTSTSMDDFNFALSSPPNSPLYDHLPPTSPVEDTPRSKAASASPPQPKKTNFLTSVEPMRRNVSQPTFSGRDEGRRSSTSPGPDSIKEEDESDEEAGDTTASETSLDHSVVVRRQKKNSTHKESDPFEDLLGTPQAVARLRWSQELNPLYDLIKGMKITESISSQDKGIRLYSTDTSSDAEKSKPVASSMKKLKKLPSVIFEESEIISPQHTAAVPVITNTDVEEKENEEVGEDEGEEEGGDEGDKIPMIIPDNIGLPRAQRRLHDYEEVGFNNQPQFSDTKSTSTAGLFAPSSPDVKKHDSPTLGGTRSAGLAGLSNPAVRRLQTLQTLQAPSRDGTVSISPRLGKRELQRRSRTISCMDDTEAVTRKQRPLRAADTMKDFSYVMREYRLFYVKMPNGSMHNEVFSINRPVAELRDKLCELLGVENVDHYMLYVEGACLTSLKEGEIGDRTTHRGVDRSNSLTHIMDHQWLPDQGNEPVMLKSALSFRMQGITTSRVLAFVCDDVVAEADTKYPTGKLLGSEEEEFHKHWMSIVQGNTPCTPDQAVKLAAIQYQAYFLDRTALHSVVGFCRPNEFLPAEVSMIRGMEQKMYKEQEKLKSMKTHKEVHEAYVNKMATLPTYNTIFFPVREPRKKKLQSTKLKPILLGVGPHGIMRVDPKTKEVLGSWDYQVLRNWAYSRKTFVLAFTDKNYPVESNQAKWISMVVDFFVDSIINTTTLQTLKT